MIRRGGMVWWPFLVPAFLFGAAAMAAVVGMVQGVAS